MEIQELKDELLSELKISKDDLKDYVLNVDGITYHYCDFCGEDCVGEFYKIKNIEITNYTHFKDMCRQCFKNNPLSETADNLPVYQYEDFWKHINKDHIAIIKPPIYAEQKSYDYDIISVKKISDHKYIYVVEEINIYTHVQDVHYYLKFYDNGNIIIDYELDTYNPYFSVDVIYLDYVDDVVTIKYHEKHCCCCVKVKPDGRTHSIYLKSKPQTFSRAQNLETKDHNIGEVVEFIKNDKIMENKNYFNCQRD